MCIYTYILHTHMRLVRSTFSSHTRTVCLLFGVSFFLQGSTWHCSSCGSVQTPLKATTASGSDAVDSKTRAKTPPTAGLRLRDASARQATPSWGHSRRPRPTGRVDGPHLFWCLRGHHEWRGGLGAGAHGLKKQPRGQPLYPYALVSVSIGFFLCIGLQCFGSSSSKVVTFRTSVVCEVHSASFQLQLGSRNFSVQV